MKPETGNLFDVSGLTAPTGPDERFDTLVDRTGLRIERIVSTGQASPAGFWYDSPNEEWVLLIAGAAALEFETPAESGDIARPHMMQPGDYVRIPAHCRHRVAWTHADEPTFWLAVHYEHT
ncbi:cupin domain-containing protein [Paraburkholderia sartisoli]|uniref:Cupin 2 domain-containing protein n=1 Tax=Paraburkholderia sartisoli TaxID=83784 RepID=A0A1H4AG14_9BURK|nr:cupin [Paraburkholderia sartisoli]SEA34462.1 cupin 2 domain-containing protein [Paraburkholderia sartisoli]